MSTSSAPPSSTDLLDINFENYVQGVSRGDLKSQLLSSNRSRIQSIDIISTGRSVAQELVDVIGPSSFPRLTSISIECYSDDANGNTDDEGEEEDANGSVDWDPDEQHTVVATLPIQAPGLNNVTLLNLSLPWDQAPFSKIKTLKIDITGRLDIGQRPSHSNVRDLLSAMHSLEHLFLGDMFPRYNGSSSPTPAKINLSSTCRSVTLRISRQHWDSMIFITSLALPPGASPLNLVLTCNAYMNCTKFVQFITSNTPRAVRIHGCEPLEELGCGIVTTMRSAAAWLASPSTVLSSTPSPIIRARFRISSPDTEYFECQEKRNEEVARFAHGLRAINLGQTQVLHLQGLTSQLLEPLLTGDEIEKTFHPLLRNALYVEVLILSGEFAHRSSAYYSALAGQNSTGAMLCPRLRTLVVTEAVWPKEGPDPSYIQAQNRRAIEGLLEVRKRAGCPLRTLLVPQSLKSDAFCMKIRSLVHVEFFDVTEAAHDSAMTWDWQAWPPTVSS